MLQVCNHERWSKVFHKVLFALHVRTSNDSRRLWLLYGEEGELLLSLPSNGNRPECFPSGWTGASQSSLLINPSEYRRLSRLATFLKELGYFAARLDDYLAVWVPS